MKYLFNDPQLTDRRRSLRRSATRAEFVLWQRLRNRQLQGFRFRRQYSVGPYILDVYCPSIGLAIEIDGQQHLTSEGIESDAQRSAFLEAHQIRVIRFLNSDVLDRPEKVLSEIKKVLPS